MSNEEYLREQDEADDREEKENSYSMREAIDAGILRLDPGETKEDYTDN